MVGVHCYSHVDDHVLQKEDEDEEEEEEDVEWVVC